MQLERDARIFRALALALLLWAVALHGLTFVSAGALWRDEANSVQQARLPSWTWLWRSLDFDSFPALFPSALRLWSSGPWTAGDQGLRVLGLLIGLALLASIFPAARMLGTRWPIVTLVLLGANAVWISEGDSIRPYGLSLLFILWTYAFMARELARPSPFNLALATLGSVLCVQTSYTGALAVGVFCLSAAGVAAARGERRRLWRFFVPGLYAAASLAVYAGVLERAREWAVILNNPVDWPRFFKGLARDHSGPLPVIWLGFLALAVWRLAVASRRQTGDSPFFSPLFAYRLTVFVVGLAVQVLFVEAAGVPPFPRYFLPTALFTAFAIEAALEGWRPRLCAAAVATALILTAWPSWSRLSLRHTNVDDIARLLAGRAAPQDLVVVSPWFLSTGFQRYYRGPCEWITVPDLERQPMMRYDLIRQAMIDHGPESGVARRLRAALDRGAAVWFVSQAPWSNFARAEAPEPLESAPAPRGPDYVRSRSYWERDIEHRLYAGCDLKEKFVPGGSVWDEEKLILTRWQKKQP